MKYFTKEVKIGLVGIVALFVLIYGINFLKGVNMFKPTSYYYVKYSDINGLAKSSPVYADGFPIGTVRDIYYDYNRPGNVTVEIKVNTGMRIPKGSRAELETELLGGVRMNLLLANNPRESYQVGDTIPGVLNNGLMEAVTEVLAPQLESILPRIDSVLYSLNLLLTSSQLNSTLGSMENIGKNLEGVTQQLNTFMRKDVPELTGKLNIIEDNFITISENLKDINYASTFDKIDQTLANVKSLTDKLNSNDNTIGLLLNDPSLYNSLTETGENAAILLEDLKNNPKRYVHFSIFGRKGN